MAPKTKFAVQTVAGLATRTSAHAYTHILVLTPDGEGKDGGCISWHSSLPLAIKALDQIGSWRNGRTIQIVEVATARVVTSKLINVVYLYKIVSGRGTRDILGRYVDKGAATREARKYRRYGNMVTVESILPEEAQ